MKVYRLSRNALVQLLPIIIICVLVGASIGCTSPYKELLRNGYYAYVLPNHILAEQEWHLKSIEQDWDAHCTGGPSAPWNPLDIVYQNQEGKKQFSITISDRDVVWDGRRTIEEITLDSPWIKENTGVAYAGEDFSPIKFTDIFGNEVKVSGQLSISEKVDWINQLKYGGPPVEKLVSPWSLEWCSSHLSNKSYVISD